MRKTVAVDLDGVLAEYHGWKGLDHIGDPIPGAQEFCRQLAEFANVTIYTTRCSVELGRFEDIEQLVGRVRDWLLNHGFEPGVHWHDIWSGQGKPIYAALVDDRAVVCDPQRFGGPDVAYRSAMRRVLDLCECIPNDEGGLAGAQVAQ